MTKGDAWMPLYTGDYLAQTGDLSTEEHGACLLLLMHQWHHGNLPSCDKRMASVVRSPARHFRRNIWPKIEHLFPEEDGVRRNARLKIIRDDANGGSLRPPPRDWAALRRQVFKRDNFTCTYCGQRGGALECDHVMPISRGGSNDPANLTTACRDCNRDKGNKTPEEWRA
jgi:hypothetical protein